MTVVIPSFNPPDYIYLKMDMFRFLNREDAAYELAEKLRRYELVDGVIMAIPRGGVPIGKILSDELEFPLQLVMAKKIGHPSNSEYAIGSVGLHNVSLHETEGIPAEYIRREINQIRWDLQDRFELFMGDNEVIDIKGKTVFIVDDGVATGRTLFMAIEEIRVRNPKEVIVAVPVASPSIVKKVKKVADALVCVHISKELHAVGQFYENFEQLTDQKVINILKHSYKTKNN